MSKNKKSQKEQKCEQCGAVYSKKRKDQGFIEVIAPYGSKADCFPDGPAIFCSSHCLIIYFEDDNFDCKAYFKDAY